MRTEFRRQLKEPLCWLIPGAGLSARAVLAVLDRLYRPERFWALAGGFWSGAGSAVMGLLVLLALLRPFSRDRETGVLPVIRSTPRGRGRLLLDRLLGGGLAAALFVLLLAGGNAALSLWLSPGGSLPPGWADGFLRATAVSLGGTLGYFLLSALVCDGADSHPAALCLCGLPFALGYFVNAGAVRPFELFWFFRYGCFTQWMRGRRIGSAPAFWAVWYAALLGLALFAALRRRKERKGL